MTSCRWWHLANLDLPREGVAWQIQFMLENMTIFFLDMLPILNGAHLSNLLWVKKFFYTSYFPNSTLIFSLQQLTLLGFFQPPNAMTWFQPTVELHLCSALYQLSYSTLAYVLRDCIFGFFNFPFSKQWFRYFTVFEWRILKLF